MENPIKPPFSWDFHGNPMVINGGSFHNLLRALGSLGSFQSGSVPDGVAGRQVQRMLVLRLWRGAKFVDALCTYSYDHGHATGTD